jgi:hypothetical protein
MRPQSFLELRPTAGAVLPTGDQRDLFDDAASFGAQLAWEYKPDLHFVGAFGWSPTRHHLAMTDGDVNVFTYDVGVEFNLVRPMGPRWELKPFVGVGAGARTYDYAEPGVDAETCQSGYATLGTEFQRGFAALRLEARDYLYCYKNPVLDRNETRNEVGLSLGVAFHVGRNR